jgi:hypothetical protein
MEIVDFCCLPDGNWVAEADLQPSQIQGMAEDMGDPLMVTAGSEIKFTVRLELDKNTSKLVKQNVNTGLEEISPDLSFDFSPVLFVHPSCNGRVAIGSTGGPIETRQPGSRFDIGQGAAEYPRHVWSYDFTMDLTYDGKGFRTLNVIDEYTRECLAMRVARDLTSEDVQAFLTELFCARGVPVHLRSDNGTEFVNQKIRTWLNEQGVKTLFIEPGSPWKNGYIENFNRKLRDELLKREIFYTLEEAKIIIEQWRKEYNAIRQHSALDYRPPAPEAGLMPEVASPQMGAVIPITT